MNDLELVRAAMPAAPLPTPNHLLPARERLLAAARTATPPAALSHSTALSHPTGLPRPAAPTPSSRPAALSHPAAPTPLTGPLAVGQVRRRRAGRRYALAAGLAGVAAAAVAGVLAMAPAAPLSLSTPGTAPAARLDARTVLALAATAAAARPDVVPRPDQYLYVKVATGGPVQQVWSSIDGTHDGRIAFVGQPDITTPGCRNGHRAVVGADNPRPIGTENCTPMPAYDPQTPTSPEPMLAYLDRVWRVDGSDVNAFGKAVLSLGQYFYLRPAQQAALFRAAGRMPGMVSYPDATDGAGRHGVGVGWGTVGGGRVVLVFDRTSYDYLGVQVYAPGSAHPTSSLASLTYRIVDRVGRT